MARGTKGQRHRGIERRQEAIGKSKAQREGDKRQRGKKEEKGTLIQTLTESLSSNRHQSTINQ